MSNPPVVHCPDCGTRYKWRDDFAGMELHCRCGCTFTPEAPEGVEVAAKDAGKPKLPFGAPKSSIQEALDAGEFAVKPSTFTDKLLPIVLLVSGFPVGVALLWVFLGEPVLFLASLGGLVAFEAIFALPVMVGALWWMAATFGEAFGRFGEVLLKVAGVTFGTGLIADVLFAVFFTTLHVIAVEDGWVTNYAVGFVGGYIIYFLLQGLASWVMFGVHPAMVAGIIACNYLLRFGAFFAAYYSLRPIWP